MLNIVEKHIFFLDDEPKIREVIKEILEKSGFKVSCFANPTECLAQLRSKKCDLLITDLKMPEKNGIELLRDIKHMVPWIPVLILTGYGNVPDAVKAMNAGALDFIEKPIHKDDFVRRIKSILKKNISYTPDLGASLSQKEMKILQLIIDGKSNKEIATMFHRSVCTIEYHRASLMRKLGAHNIVALIKHAVLMGLVDLKEKPLAKKPEY